MLKHGILIMQCVMCVIIAASTSVLIYFYPFSYSLFLFLVFLCVRFDNNNNCIYAMTTKHDSRVGD